MTDTPATEPRRDSDTPDAPAKRPARARWLLPVAIGVVAVVTFGLTLLLVNILERQQEAKNPYTQVVELDETTVDPAIWGQNFPIQYEQYLKTEEFTPTKYGGSELQDHEPTADDPREKVPPSKIEEDPRLKIMWDGYAFAVDYRHARGHQHMLDDQRRTLRVTQFDQPGTCLNCHASTVPVMDELGNGDRRAGFDAMNAMTYKEVTEYADHPVACIDCHDPDTMALTITRPAFEDGIKALKASQGIEDYDVNRDATNQEMRSYVCAQCHVEYYFTGEGNTLTFPWAKGIDIDDIWDYYMDNGHVDWVHATTGAEVLKAQHPEFDIWSNGIHADNGVSCADCHMAYERDGAHKVTNHHITNPMIDANASCGTCHSDSADDMKRRVETIQDRFVHSRDQAFDALVALIRDIEKGMADGVDEAQLDLAREYQNKASFYIDYVYSENSYGFHAPDYTQRILNDALDAARKGQLAVSGVSAEELAASDVTQKNIERVGEETAARGQ
ncbi:MAG: ammonia-forming cytochrome c nitrite reductase subunit c552 [Bowdeniella nasicola]|nr:ammonia-forming cytochrome c nitrite reductase subunit c552 [Bowdeniella nasicola]